MEEMESQPTVNTKVRSSSCLLSCFGVSHEDSDDGIIKKRKKSMSWFNRSKSRSRSSGGAKTVPVETALPELSDLNKNIDDSESDKLEFRSKLVLKSRRNVAGKPKIIPDPTPAIAPIGKAAVEVEDGSEQEDTREKLERRVTTTPESFCRKIELIRTAVSQPGSPENKQKPPRRNVARNGNKPAATVQTRPVVNNPIDENGLVGEKYDPIVGLSVVMVTLIIMLVWGKLCAILCTSAWFYFLPRLRITGRPDGFGQIGLNSTDPDLNSERYKKKVVMEGFLSRNHQSAL